MSSASVVADHRGRICLAIADAGDVDRVAPEITWLLVSISPEEVSTIPVPAASSPA